ncbi:MAG: hypothetical protein ACI9I0_001728, partial [Rhodoferax sp.]
ETIDADLKRLTLRSVAALDQRAPAAAAVLQLLESKTLLTTSTDSRKY